MFKLTGRIASGRMARLEDDLLDRNGLLILDGHIREFAMRLERTKRALALTIAQQNAEERHLKETVNRLSDLEQGAVAALMGGVRISPRKPQPQSPFWRKSGTRRRALTPSMRPISRRSEAGSPRCAAV